MTNCIYSQLQLHRNQKDSLEMTDISHSFTDFLKVDFRGMFDFQDHEMSEENFD